MKSVRISIKEESEASDFYFVVDGKTVWLYDDRDVSHPRVIPFARNSIPKLIEVLEEIYYFVEEKNETT